MSRPRILLRSRLIIDVALLLRFCYTTSIKAKNGHFYAADSSGPNSFLCKL